MQTDTRRHVSETLSLLLLWCPCGGPAHDWKEMVSLWQPPLPSALVHQMGYVS